MKKKSATKKKPKSLHKDDLAHSMGLDFSSNVIRFFGEFFTGVSYKDIEAEGKNTVRVKIRISNKSLISPELRRYMDEQCPNIVDDSIVKASLRRKDLSEYQLLRDQLYFDPKGLGGILGDVLLEFYKPIAKFMIPDGTAGIVYSPNLIEVYYASEESTDVMIIQLIED